MFFDKNTLLSNFFRKKSAKYLVVRKKLRTFAPANQKSTAAFSASRNRRGAKEGSVAQLNRASFFFERTKTFQSALIHAPKRIKIASKALNYTDFQYVCLT